MEQIDLTIAKQMVARYESTRKELIDSTYNISDTKSVWFDIAAFKNFVNALPTETTGVRVYLAANADDETTAPGQTTVIFVGTETNGTSNVDALTTGTSNDVGFQPVNKGLPCPPECV